jgi:L-lactate permease
MLEVLPAVLVAGGSFALMQFVVSNVLGPELTDILAALLSLASVAILLRFWSPRTVDRVDNHAAPSSEGRTDSTRRVARAYGSYAILVVVILAGQVGNFAGLRELEPPLNVTAVLRCGQPGNALCPEPWIGPGLESNPQAFRFPVWGFHWPGSYSTENGRPTPLVYRGPPIVEESSPYALTFRLDFLATAGTMVLLASFFVFLVMRMFGLSWRAFPETFLKTLQQLRLPIVTIAFILSIATVMNYSGMTSSMALALAATGVLFPFFSAFLGMLGVFLTGSDTASNTLFGPLQATTARVTGLDPILTAATNSSGGVMGKMISPQNLSVGAAGVGAVGREGEILRRVVGHSLLLTALMGLLAMLQAYVFPGIVPSP